MKTLKTILTTSLTALIFNACVEKNELSNNLYAPIQATLLTGTDFTLDFNKTEFPLIFEDKNSCKYLANAEFSIQSERAYISLEKKICFNDNKIKEYNIKGFAVEDDMKTGLNVEVNYSNKYLIAKLAANKKVKLFITEEKE